MKMENEAKKGQKVLTLIMWKNWRQLHIILQNLGGLWYNYHTLRTERRLTS